MKDAGIRIIAFSVDGVAGNKGSAQDALKMLKKLKWPFEAGFAHENFLKELQETQDFLTGRMDPLSLPMSFLLDPKNRVAAIYRGIVDVDQVMDDASVLDRSLSERWMRAVPHGGRVLDDPHFISLRNQSEATAMYRLGKRYEDRGNLPGAQHYMETALKYWPDFEEVKTWLSRNQ